MTFDFATAEARLGQSILAKLSNATLRFDADAPETAVSGIWRDSSREAMLGVGIAASELTFECATADLPENLAEGSPVTLVYREVETGYVVGEILPSNQHRGSSVLSLRLDK